MEAHIRELHDRTVGQDKAVAGKRVYIQSVCLRKPTVNLAVDLKATAYNQTFELHRVNIRVINSVFFQTRIPSFLRGSSNLINYEVLSHFLKYIIGVISKQGNIFGYFVF